MAGYKSYISAFVIAAIACGVCQSCQIVCQPGQFLDPLDCICINFDDLGLGFWATTPAPTRDPNVQCLRQRCAYTRNPCAVYHTDKQGCPTCRCKCSKLLLSCPTDCKYGSEFTLNKEGCKVCQCAPRPEVILKEKSGVGRRCPPVCQMYCPFGNILDSDGCPTCACENSLPW